jgi:hypothetical protein
MDLMKVTDEPFCWELVLSVDGIDDFLERKFLEVAGVAGVKGGDTAAEQCDGETGGIKALHR